MHPPKYDNRIKLYKTNARIFAYGTSTPLNLAGEFIATVTSASGTSTTSKFYVTQSKSKCILGYESSSSLGLITLNLNNINPDQRDPDVQKIIDKHAKLFQGTGNQTGCLRYACTKHDTGVQIPNSKRNTPKDGGTEVDLSQGYLQLTLAEESRYITAFSTPEDGLHRFKRLIMGEHHHPESTSTRLSISSSKIYQIAKIFWITFGYGLKKERHTSSS